MCKTPFALAVIVPPVLLIVSGFLSPRQGVGQAPAPTPAPEAHARNAFVRVSVDHAPSPNSLDFTVALDVWVGAEKRNVPGSYPAVLKVMVFGADDPDGDSIASFVSPAITPTRGKRDRIKIPFHVPDLAPGIYEVETRVESIKPMVWNRNGVRTSAPLPHASKRTRLKVK